MFILLDRFISMSKYLFKVINQENKTPYMENILSFLLILSRYFTHKRYSIQQPRKVFIQQKKPGSEFFLTSFWNLSKNSGMESFPNFASNVK